MNTTPIGFAARLTFSAFLVLATLGFSGCEGPTGLDHWTNYPSQHASTRFSRWAVVKCTFSDDTTARMLPDDLAPEFKDLDTYLEYFLTLRGAETGNLVDYLHDVTYGARELQAKIYGWYNAPFASTDKLDRRTRIEQCLNEMPETDLAAASLEDLDGVIMITNKTQDGGACVTGKAKFNVKGITYELGCLTFDANSLYTGFAAHELGHGLGLPHSVNTTLVDYTDPFDVMSALNTFMFDWPNYPGEGPARGRLASGPGMSVPNLMRLGAIPGSRLDIFTAGDAERDIQLSALSHPEAAGKLAVWIAVPGEIPGVGGYTVEYRVPDGWDQRLNRDIVLVHRSDYNGRPNSILQTGPVIFNRGGSGFKTGDRFDLVNVPVLMTVKSMNAAEHTAVVTVRSR